MTEERAFGADDVADAVYAGQRLRKLRSLMTDNTGEWLRGQTEHCLLGARSKPVFLHGSDGTALEAARREHSRKPEEFYALVERICPGSLIELFSRQQREGWMVFGDQTELFGMARAVGFE